jgi:hypothetical protein
MATRNIRPGAKVPRKLKKQGPGRGYDLYKAIKQEEWFKNSTEVRDDRSREFIESQCDTIAVDKSLVIGNMVYFDYFEPKLQEELDYYDAKPVVLLFGRTMTKQGKRVIGFNIHYYPPSMRFRVLSKIVSIFKDNFLKKTWWNGQTSDMSAMDYKFLLKQLEKAKLTFGVREYIPELMRRARVVPPQYFSKVVFTEGAFKKRTRQMVMNYWKQYKQK